MGFALVFAGGKGVVWFRPKPDFPYVDGFVPVVLSWFISPVASGIVAAILFLLVRTLVLRRINSTKIAIWVSAPPAAGGRVGGGLGGGSRVVHACTGWVVGSCLLVRRLLPGCAGMPACTG
jgi:phosphate/sulfate permease